MGVSKGAAFVLGVSLMAAFGVMETIFPGRNAHTVSVIGSIGTITGAYIGLQIANNGVKGKWWNQRMRDSERMDEWKEGRNDGEKQEDACGAGRPGAPGV